MSEIWLQHPFNDHDENLASTSSFTSSMLATSSDFKHVNNLIDLDKNLENGGYLSDGVPAAYPTLLLTQENEFINPSLMLPHKKRIPRKLKSISDEKEFQCEICGHCTLSQMDFFSHLKGHYEPISSDLSSMKILLSPIEPKKHETNEIGTPNMCYFGTNQMNHDTNMKNLNSNSLEGSIEFGNYQNEMKFEANNPSSEIKVFSPSTLKKCDVDLEFSDTDDTELENTIRNVVDKVSIEDSCDEIGLMASSGTLRESWFTNSNYPSIMPSPLKTDCNFVQILENLPPEQPMLVIEDAAQHSNGVTSFCLEKENEKSKPYLGKFLPEDSTTCDERLSLQAKTTHKYLKKKIPVEKDFYCEKCKRKFNSGNALKYHIRASHTGVRPHQCDFCGCSFFAKGALNSHTRTHTGEKPFQCTAPNCQKKFRQLSDMKYHMTSKHSDEKNHQCEFCGKSFARKYSLVLHIRIHENEKNYKCEFCDKAFRANSYLQNHRKIHTGEKPHGCVCGKRFRVLGDLRRHYRIHQRQKGGSLQNHEETLPEKSNDNTKTYFKSDDDEPILGL